MSGNHFMLRWLYIAFYDSWRHVILKQVVATWRKTMKQTVFLFPLLMLLNGCTVVKEKDDMTMEELLNMPTEKLLNLSVKKKKH